MTLEFIFAVVTAVFTGVAGWITKDSVVPSKFIPIQNIIIGVVAAFIAIHFNLFNDIPTAILVSLGMSLGVGGGYDALQTPNK